MNSQLPAEALELGFDPAQYKMGDEISFRGPCLHCGGSKRMAVFLNGEFPAWYLRCDLCGSEGWLSSFFNENEIQRIIDLGPLTRIDNDRARRLQEELERNLVALDGLQSWMRYHDNLDQEQRRWWSNAGIPPSWQDFWLLGYVPDRTFQHEDQIYTKPAYTIPKFEVDWKIKNIDYRLVDPPLGVGKYRPEYGLAAAPFISRPDLTNGHTPDRVLVCEGSKKAMVASLYLEGMLVFGVPAARSWAGVDQRLKDGPEVVVVLDPDAEAAARKLTKLIGGRAKYLQLPTKLDDAFIEGHITGADFWRLVKYNGRKVRS